MKKFFVVGAFLLVAQVASATCYVSSTQHVYTIGSETAHENLRVCLSVTERFSDLAVKDDTGKKLISYNWSAQGDQITPTYSAYSAIDKIVTFELWATPTAEGFVGQISVFDRYTANKIVYFLASQIQ